MRIASRSLSEFPLDVVRIDCVALACASVERTSRNHAGRGSRTWSIRKHTIMTDDSERRGRTGADQRYAGRDPEGEDGLCPWAQASIGLRGVRRRARGRGPDR